MTGPCSKLVLALLGVLALLVTASWLPLPGRALTDDDRLREIETAFAEGSHRTALEKCAEAVDSLEGDARGRCVAIWALCAEELRQWNDLRALYEKEIDRVSFPHSATLAEAYGRYSSRQWGGWSKLEPLEKALRLREEGGEAHREAWCATALDLIEGLSLYWQHDIPASEWEKQPQPEDPQERRRAYELWATARGIAEDERRWSRTETLFDAILERTEESGTRAQALFERGMRRLVAIGAVPGFDVRRSASVETMIERLGETDVTRRAGESLAAWRDEVLLTIADWQTLVTDLPNEGLADDAGYLIPYVTEQQLGDLVLAASRYSDFLRRYPESQWTSDARTHREGIVREGLSLLEQVELTSPGTSPTVVIEARNVDELSLSLWEVPDYLDRVESERALSADPSTLASGPAQWTWQVATECADDHKARRVEITLPVDTAGAYRLRIAGAASTIDIPVFVSAIALDVEGGSDEAFAWATDASDGTPIAEAEVLLRLDIRRRDERRSWTTRLRTDARGLVRWKYPERFLPLLEQGWRLDRLAAVVERGADISPAASFSPTHDSGRRPRLVSYLETDRPVYRPGQEVHYKITLRHWNGETYELPDLGEVLVKFSDPQGNPLLEMTQTLDAAATVSGTIVLSSEVTLGMCGLRVEANGDEIQPRDWRRQAFRVEEYRRPEFEVSIEAPGDPVLYGDPLTVTIRGNFLSGEPVRGGKVRVRVQRQPFDFAYDTPSPYPWKREPRPNWWGFEDVFSGEATLDAEGIAEFTVPTTERGDSRDSTYKVEAWLTDNSQREEQSVASFPVTRTELFAHCEPVVRIVSPGEPLEVKVRTMDARETGRASSGTIEIAKRVDREKEVDGKMIPFIDWEPISTTPFQVSADGSIFRTPAETEGELRITYRAIDARGHAFEGSCRLWVVGPDFTGRDYTLDGLQVVTSTPVADIGTTARAVILTERENATILVLRSAAGRILSLETVQANGNVAQIEFLVTDAEAPNFFINAWAVWEGTMHRASAEVKVPPTPYFLEGVLSASEDELLPGAEVELDLQLRDHRGRAIEGSWSLTLFDRAVLAIQPEFHDNPMQQLHERQWRFTLRGSNSTAYRSHHRFSWLAGYEPIDRPDHRLPDILRRTWQRRFQYLAAYYFPEPAALPSVARHDFFFGEEQYDGESKGEILSLGDDARGGAPGARDTATASPASEMAPRERSRSSSRLAGKKAAANFDADGGDAHGGQGGAEEMAPVRIRSNFSETAVWEPNFRTDANGRGTLKVTLPDSLTEWNGIARGIDPSGRAFEARVQIRTRRNIRLRLATPRFLREGDQVVLALVASNQFDEPVRGTVHLDYPAALLTHLDGRSTSTESSATGTWSQEIELPAKGEHTIELPFAVRSVGEANFVAMIATPKESDGLQRSLPVLPYGLDRMIGGAGLVPDIDGYSSDAWTFAIPELSDAESRSVTIDLTPSPAIALIESLPYLVRYPYGCVEQTLNRFVPAVIVADMLKETGVDLAEILPERAEKFPAGFWGHLEERPLDLFRPADLEHLLTVGKLKLERAQNGDGSWGWWSGYHGDPYITALVVEHLCTAQEVGIAVDTGVIRNGASWLVRHVIGRDLEGELQIYERSGLEELAWVARALLHAAERGLIPYNDDVEGLYPLLDFLHRHRGRLGAQGQAMLALALHDSDREVDHERARVVIRNLYDEQGGQGRFGTVHFGKKNSHRWYDHGVESTAWALRALIAIDPEDPRIGDVVRWLLENRAGNHYDSTRSTAAVALALTDHLRSTGELDCDLTATVILDGTEVGTYTVDRETIFTKRGRITVPASLLESGEHTLEIVRSGTGPLHWSAMVEFYSREDPVPAGGNRVELAREVFRLVDKKVPREEEYVHEGKAVIRTVEEWVREREPLADGARVRAGDRILVELAVNSANDFRYVSLENPKPAGFETITQQSGYVGGIYGYRELRDEKVVWFVSRLPEGESKVSIELRAERDGTYRVVPAVIEAMYLPHVRANSTSGVLTIE